LYEYNRRDDLKKRTHSEKTRKILAEKTRAHPKTGHFPTNHNAKAYSLKSPNGKIFQFRNLSYFVEKHREEFTELYNIIDDAKLQTIHTGLANLAPRIRKPKKSWRGWTWHDCGGSLM